LAGWTGLVFFFLFAPLIVVVIFGFNSSQISTLPIEGFSLRWYSTFAANQQIQEALRNSLIVGSVTVILSTALGVILAVGIHRYTTRLKTMLNSLSMLPMMTPRLILGISLLTFYSFFNVSLSLFTVIIGHIIIGLPYVVLIVSARLVGFDRFLEEAAHDLGANSWVIFREITLPFLRPAIIGGALIAFTLSFDDVVVAFFTTGADNTLPMAIWSRLRFGLTPEINAIATCILFLSTVVVIIAEVLIRKVQINL
jgi:spermidine/putrescine transport system permease protein